MLLILSIPTIFPPLFYISYILMSVNDSFQRIFYSIIFQQILGTIAHNVPAVYDVFASPIKETVGFQGLQKCGWSGAWEA
jgi:hypothetical protein